ncbi:hypothetical protein [Micromonospora zhanjiangensis]
MTNPAAPASTRPSGPGVLLPLLLTVALLIPVGVLFGQVWRDVDADRTFAARERDGVGYLRALIPVATALADAQTTALTGRPTNREAVDRAVQNAAAVDSRLGGALRTQERWAGLRAKIEALPERRLANPNDTLTAYRETTDLLLALFDKVRDSSGLVRDPDADAAQLQQAAGRDLPTALIATGRLADAVALAPARPNSEAMNTVADLTAARLAALGSVNAVVNALRSAVDSTESTELGGNVLTKFDRYQRAAEQLAFTSAQPPAAAPKQPAGTGSTDGTGAKGTDAADQPTAGTGNPVGRLPCRTRRGSPPPGPTPRPRRSTCPPWRSPNSTR